jgi:glycine cleavage system aminomethyltransferase T
MVGAPLHAGDKAVGVVTSATRSPSLGLAALAYVHRSVEQGAVIDVATAGDDRWAAEVRSLPMVSGPGPGAPR